MHIYTDERPGAQVEKSVEIAARVLDGKDPFIYTTAVMIDDYNPADSSLDVEAFFVDYREKGTRIDAWTYESKLVGYEEQLMGSITDSRLRREYERYRDQKVRLPCSFLTAAW